MSSASAHPLRLNVNLPASARAEVDQMADNTGRSITELVRLGLSLVKVVLNESRLGNKIVVTTSEGKAIKELIIPS